jgi:signal recognition particle subunit SRP54
MGDVLSLIEKAEATLDEKKALEFEKKLRANKFDFEDYLEQMRQVRKLGPLNQILGLIPGLSGAMGKLQPAELELGEKQLRRVEAMICSMTTQERRNPNLINGSRRRRIAAGSGTTVQDINQLLTQFEQMKKMMRGMTQGGMPGMPAGMPGIPSRGGKHAGSNKKNKRKPTTTFKLPFGRG